MRVRTSLGMGVLRSVCAFVCCFLLITVPVLRALQLSKRGEAVYTVLRPSIFSPTVPARVNLRSLFEDLVQASAQIQEHTARLECVGVCTKDEHFGGTLS